MIPFEGRRTRPPRTVTRHGVSGLLVPLRTVPVVVTVALGLLSVVMLAHTLRAVLDHYLAEPGDRHELGTSAALSRWRSARG